MSVIDVKAQQIVLDALARDRKNVQKVILCHTPSKLRADSGMFLSTQDRLQELFASSSDSVVAVFPNANLVRRLCKRCQGETFSVDLVFACHASSDPNDLVLIFLANFRQISDSFMKFLTWLRCRKKLSENNNLSQLILSRLPMSYRTLSISIGVVKRLAAMKLAYQK